MGKIQNSFYWPLRYRMGRQAAATDMGREEEGEMEEEEREEEREEV